MYGKITIYKTIASSAILLLIVGTGGTYSILYNIRTSYVISENAKIGTISDWIGYSGSIIGGSMTMFALVFTIQNEDSKRRKDEQFRIMPIIECTKISNPNDLTIGTHINLKFENLSEFPMRSLSMDHKRSFIRNGENKSLK